MNHPPLYSLVAMALLFSTEAYHDWIVYYAITLEIINQIYLYHKRNLIVEALKKLIKDFKEFKNKQAQLQVQYLHSHIVPNKQID